MKNKQIIAVFFLTFGLILLGAQIRYRDLLIDIAISQIIFAITAFILVKKNVLKGKWKYSLIPLSIVLWYIIVFLIEMGIDYLVSNTPNSSFFSIGTVNILVMCPLGATYGALLASGKKQRIYGIVLILVSAVFSYWYINTGSEYWYNYCFEGTFTGKVKEQKLSQWQRSINPDDTMPESTYKDKFVVLDFWTVSCIICFQKFPEFDSLNKAYKGNDKVMFQAVNLPWGDDSRSKIERGVELGKKYTFKNVYADSAAWKTFNIDGVPTVLILKNDEVVFRGSIELAKDFLKENVK